MLNSLASGKDFGVVMKDLKQSLEFLKDYIDKACGLERADLAEDLKHAVDHIIVDHCEAEEE